jgi:hypothetical protein
MKILILYALILVPLMAGNALAETSSQKYTECMIQGFYENAPNIKNCDFSNIRGAQASVFRTCNMQLVQELPDDLGDIRNLMANLENLKSQGLERLNNDLNSRLYSCGYMGEIELQENSGRVEILKFKASEESCEKLRDIIDGNNQEYPTASGERQDEIRKQNLALNRIRATANCQTTRVQVQGQTQSSR